MALIKEPNKQQIVNAAIDLFAERGIAKVSIVQIAKAIGATRGMVYHYFEGGKEEIITSILQAFEDCIRNCIPNPEEWESKDADAKQILFGLFFHFPSGDTLTLRKITRIIMSEMFHNTQIKEYAIKYFITGRENLLRDCLAALERNGKIAPLGADIAARYFNSNLVVYAMKDALRYPYIDDEESAAVLQEQAVRDCTFLLNTILRN